MPEIDVHVILGYKMRQSARMNHVVLLPPVGEGGHKLMCFSNRKPGLIRELFTAFRSKSVNGVFLPATWKVFPFQPVRSAARHQDFIAIIKLRNAAGGHDKCLRYSEFTVTLSHHSKNPVQIVVARENDIQVGIRKKKVLA